MSQPLCLISYVNPRGISEIELHTLHLLIFTGDIKQEIWSFFRGDTSITKSSRAKVCSAALCGGAVHSSSLRRRGHIWCLHGKPSLVPQGLFPVFLLRLFLPVTYHGPGQLPGYERAQCEGECRAQLGGIPGCGLASTHPSCSSQTRLYLTRKPGCGLARPSPAAPETHWRTS